jgi:hypothetical protein
MGANPNRISSPFGTTKAAASHPRLTQSAQVSEATPYKAPEPGTARRKLHCAKSVPPQRMADLEAAQDAARHRHIAAKGMVTRARKDGSADKIAAAVRREREAYGEFMAVSDASIGEMLALNRAGLDRLELLDQIGPAWDADAGVLREITGRDAEAGQ